MFAFVRLRLCRRGEAESQTVTNQVFIVAVAECRCFSQPSRSDLMMKSRRRKDADFGEVPRAEHINMRVRNQRWRDCDLYVTFYLSVTYRAPRLGALCSLASFICFFFFLFFSFKQFKNVVFDCLCHQNRSLMEAALPFFTDAPKGAANVTLTGRGVDQLLMCHLV